MSRAAFVCVLIGALIVGILIAVRILPRSSIVPERRSGARVASEDDRKRFDALEIGMTRAAVESLLGPPRSDLNGDWYYGGSPVLKPFESPNGPGCIILTYTPNNKLATKIFQGDVLR